MMKSIAKILVLGASGLIGRFVTDDLRAAGLSGDRRRAAFLAVAKDQRASISRLPVMSMDAAALARLIARARASMSWSIASACCRTAPAATPAPCTRDFVGRLLQAIRDSGRAIRLVHISIPGTADEDRTAFSTTKREAERLIAASGIAYAILRPGFVVAPVGLWRQRHAARAGGVSARNLPADESATPFQPVAVEDIAATIAWLAGARHRRRRGAAP